MNKKKQEEYKLFLEKVKKVFEPRYGKELEPDFIEHIARNLINYSCVCHNAMSRGQGKKPKYQI
jgi:predicted SprT family Zn-dependent metalloprotease